MQLTSKFQWFLCLVFSIMVTGIAAQDSNVVYKKRVLEAAEVELLTSFYMQDGDHAAVTGGIGTEELTDATGAIVVSIPIRQDGVLKVDAAISAYSSASSSNVDPFDGNQAADAFVASSGASKADVWSSIKAAYSHSSDDRNNIYSGNISFASEYDYSSFGLGGIYTRLMNEKNTELSLSAGVYFDGWNRIYPAELRGSGGGDDDFNINNYTITGNTNYTPQFQPLTERNRNSYSVGLSFSQILSKRIQISISTDLVRQTGLLSTPFQRVYFADVANSYIENFHLADDIERLPSNRSKLAIGGRLNSYVNHVLVVRSFYRFYVDDWGIQSHTAKLELPIRIAGKFSLYPSYRFYNQSAADYFAPYDEHFSTAEFYTSDNDLSSYHAHQVGFGVNYADPLVQLKLWKIGLKSIDLKVHHYQRNNGFSAMMISGGLKFVID